jgi:hypothetical protein
MVISEATLGNRDQDQKTLAETYVGWRVPGS